MNETFLMYSMNKTRQWLQEMDVQEKSALMVEAQKQGRKLCVNFRKRCAMILEKRKEALKGKEKALAEKKKRVLAQKENLSASIVYFSLWQSEDQVNRMLDELTTETEKRNATELKLKFQKEVLKQEVADKAVFQLGKKGDNGKIQRVDITAVEAESLHIDTEII